eukprot:TRINITY_DN20941_c0_g1_i1.p1 TRINITY_DN20941_c0_g1~~TRINITY_DN20941_c0_g1_i1.p1  ORF type:complete len:190 (-),score=25.71 TRINITY_DN20941_c0_g1_i1:214-783(-)
MLGEPFARQHQAGHATPLDLLSWHLDMTRFEDKHHAGHGRQQVTHAKCHAAPGMELTIDNIPWMLIPEMQQPPQILGRDTGRQYLSGHAPPEDKPYHARSELPSVGSLHSWQVFAGHDAPVSTDVASPPQAILDSVAPSIGSNGHPYNCQDACKYASRPRGCKDGEACSRCHVCKWKKRPKKKSIVFKL